MRSYLDIAPKYLSAHKKKTRLTILSVIMAVTLVVSIFSMLDALVTFEKTQVLKDEGNYHILVRNPSVEEINSIRSRIDVKNSGRLTDIGEGTMNNSKCYLAAVDDNFAGNLNFKLTQGKYPAEDNEVMLEKWAMENSKPTLKVGDSIKATLPEGKVREFKIVGQYSDWGATQAASIPVILVSVKASESIAALKTDYFILFKDGVNINSAKESIKKALNLPDSRLAQNDRLLALMLQSKNNRVMNIYAMGVVLFLLVLVTAVVMIYNTFNISVMERIRQFGLLRCIGASRRQIKRIVRKEAFTIALKGVPVGVIIGSLLTIICSAVLKFYNHKLFGNIPLINISVLGIAAGIAVGFLTVFIASLAPAKKAAKIFPVNALTGNNEVKTRKKKKLGLLMRPLHPQLAMGINNAVNRKTRLFLMSSSIAFSIIIFLAFNTLVNPAYMGMSAIKEYTPDVSLTAKGGINKEVYERLAGIKGIKRIYGRMSANVNASFDPAKLTEEYKKSAGVTITGNNGMFLPSEKSWLLSYDKTQLNWAKEYLIGGSSDEEKLNAQNGIIAAQKNMRNKVLTKVVNLQIGDKVNLETAAGIREFTVMGVVEAAPYRTDDQTITTFIVTEKQFAEISGAGTYNVIDVQLDSRNQEETIEKIKSMAGSSITIADKRQLNKEAKNSFMTVAVFIYGFVGVIVMISILNIINTMNTSVAAKTRYLGVMRAVGMTGDQLSVLVLSEAAVYSFSGCLAGCVFGVMFKKVITDFLQGSWNFPLLQVVLIFVFFMLTAAVSVTGPLKRIKNRGISEVIAAL